MSFYAPLRKCIYSVLSICFCTSVFAQDFLPSALLRLDSTISHHVLVAEKSTHLLHLFENFAGVPKLVKSYQVVTGKKAGNKIFQGDFRTPEGIYFLTEFIPRSALLERYGEKGKIYGVGAFVMDYPNPMDRKLSKTGGGIWLHSTNDETRIEKGLDSRGCVVAANNDLKDISTFIELHRTNIVVVHNLNYLKRATWEKERNEISDAFDDWLDAWQTEDIKRYLSHYHKKEFSDPYRGDYWGLASHKRAVFWAPGAPIITVKEISILKSKNYATVTFLQDYQSKTIQDTGKKTLYLKRDEYYQWKIVSELWTKKGVPEQNFTTIAFRPSMRFFKNGEGGEKGNN